MKKLFLLASVFALTMTTQVFAQEETTPVSQPCPIQARQNFHKMERPKFNIEQFENKLGLTDKQKKQAKELRDKNDAKVQPLKNEMNKKMEEVKAILDERLTFNERKDKLIPIHKEMRDLRKQIWEIKKEGREEFKKILTKDQLAKLDTMRPHKMHKRAFRHHRRPMDFKDQIPTTESPMPKCNCNCNCIK